MKKLSTLCFISICMLVTFVAQAKKEELNKVVAVVDSSAILESDVREYLKTIKSKANSDQQSLPSEKALRTQIIDKLINEAIVLELADKMGVIITDEELDQTIENIATKQANMSVDELIKQLSADGVSFESYRESIRKQLISNQVLQANLRRRIKITDQEVENLLTAMKAQTNNQVDYHLGHILIAFPAEPSQEDLDKAKKRAEKVIELLKNDGDFSKIAIASSGDDKALSGGDFGWKNINEMPTLFAEVVDGKDKGEVFGPIRTGLGFSIVKILDIRGKQVVEVEEVKARHILIEPSVIVSEAKAESILQGFLDKIKAGEADFAELAKEHSDGPSGAQGGDLGWSDPEKYDAAFRDALATLEVDEYHKPFRSSFGWHIVQLTGRRTLDASQQINENKAYQMLYKSKYDMESARWLKETRERAYIEVFEQEDN